MANPWQRFANELRATIEDFMAYERSDADLSEATERLALLRLLLAGPEAPRSYHDPRLTDLAHADEVTDRFLNATPFGGRNPVSPVTTTTYHADPDRPYVSGTAVIGRPFEGPAMSSHGGVVAGLFDHYLGNAQHAWSLAHNSFVVACTMELTIRYHAPTPLDTELEFEAFYEDVDEKHALAVGTCRAGDVLTASAEGRFRKVDPARFFSMKEGGFGAIERSPKVSA